MFLHSSVNKIQEILCITMLNYRILGCYIYIKCFNICTWKTVGHYDLNCVPLKILEVLTPSTCKLGLCKGNQIKVSSLGWALIHYN